MSLPKLVTLVEVSPRDGLQNEPQYISTDLKLELIQHLVYAGLKTIEVTSFVSEKRIPQLADHTAVMTRLPSIPTIRFSVLVPNLTGFHAALEAGARNIAIFASASETFSQKNIHCSIQESMDRFAAVIKQAKKSDIPVRAYISCCLGCPYEGVISPRKVAELAKNLHRMGCYEIALSDTIGVGTPRQARDLVRLVSRHLPLTHLAAHFHDTYGQALANLYAVLQEGITVIDASVAGLGGCPYAKGSSGNVATEDVVYMLHGLGISTGINLTKLIEAGQFICQHLNKPPHSKVSLAFSQSKSAKEDKI